MHLKPTVGKLNEMFGHRLRRALTLSCLAAFITLPGPLLGAGDATRKVVKVPCANFNHLMVLDERNAPVFGYAYDYIQTIATYAGWKVEYIPCESFAGCVKMLLSGEADLFYDVSYTEERATMILYPDEPMGHEYYYLYALERNTSVTPGDYASLNGKSVGTTAGTMIPDMLRQWCARKNVELEFVEYEDIPTKEADLKAGKIDLDLEISMLAKRELSAIEKIGSSAYYLVANKERQDLIDDINSAMDKLLNNDIYYFSRLQERYFSETVLIRNLTTEERRWIADHKAMRVGYFDNYLPFSTRDKDGNPIGAGIDAVREIVRRLKLDEDLKVEFICFDNQDAAYRAVESGEIDLMLPAYISTSVKRDYRIMGGKILSSLASDLAFSSDNWAGKDSRIGVNRNNLMQYYYTRDSFPNSEIVFYDSIGACLDGVLARTSEGTLLNGLRSEALLKPTKYRSLTTVRAMNDFQFRMAFADGNLGLMFLMDRGLTMLDPDFVNNACYYYVGRLYSFNLTDYLRAHIAAVIASVAFLVGLIVALVGYWVGNRRLASMNRKLTGINKELRDYSETIEKQKRQESELREQLERNQDELKDALHMAQAASRAKTTFLSNMSHDIRTPMNAIIGFTGIAESNIDDKERVKDCLATISRSSEHLLNLINDILDMSRIESGKVTLKEEVVSLPEVLDSLRDVVQADIQAKHHDFTVEMDGVKDKLVLCDKLRLNEVLLNLVSNAIKYTRDGGTISLRLIQKPSAMEGYGVYEIRCKDNGIGIGEDFAKVIFDQFAREENSTVSGIQGTGLGMAITKKIVDMMGGTISVDSVKGKGSEFIVSLEFRIAHGKAPDKTGEEDLDISLKGKRVLMVDDSALNLKIGVLLLEKRGVVVDTASNGKIAVDKIREKGVDAYDLVVMDVQMPVMDGYEATSLIRKLPHGDKLKVIAFSANAFEEDRAKSMEAGMDGHIAKPLKIEELLKELRRFVANPKLLAPNS